MTRLRLRHCITAWALVGVGFLAPLSQKLRDPDLWWHLTTGELIVRTHTIPTHDLFSFTAAGREWVTHEWLSEVIMFSIYSHAGLRGILLFRAFFIMMMCLGIYALIHRRTRNGVLSASVAALLTLAANPLWSERPQLFSYVLLICLLNIIDRWREGGSLWWAVPLFALWVNLHGAWIAGMGVLMMVIGEDVLFPKKPCSLHRRLRPLAVGLLAMAALFANPIGMKLITYPLQYLGSTYHTKYIYEWRRAELRDWQLYPYFFVLAGTAFLAVRQRARARYSEWILAVGTAAASLYSVRHVPLGAILIAPLLAAQLSDLTTSVSRKSKSVAETYALNLVLLIALGLLVLLKFPFGGGPSALIDRSKFPVRAVDFLSAQKPPGDRLVIAYDWGGYAIYRLYPRYKVSIDGRADVYGAKLMEEDDRLWRLKPGWKQVLQRWRPDVVLWPRKRKLAESLQHMPGWKRVYSDRLAVVYERTDKI